MNVPLPDALLFYPAIAVVAEFIFHAMPLAALCVAFPICVRGTHRRGRWVAFLTVASIEPALQVAWGFGHSPPWANAYVGLHLLVFNWVGLMVFERKGFMAMYVLRLAYYTIWHVAWGQARLALLWG